MYIPALGHVSQGTLALLIPIVAIIGAFASGMFSVYQKVRRQREMLQLYHAERMAAIEKGIELPPLPPELFNERCCGYTGRRDPIRRRYVGILTLFVGLAITVALWQTSHDHSFWWGLTIVAVGLGQIVIHYLERRDSAANRSVAPPPGTGPGNSAYPGCT